MKTIITSFILIFIFISCNESKDQGQIIELDTLYKQEIAIHCQLEKMKDTISEKWDNVNETLEEYLPETMPEEEKTNILKVRNASLIRMFQSYKDLDDSIHHQVDQTEKIDQSMAQRITKKRKELIDIEKQKNAILLELSKKDKNFDVTKYSLNIDADGIEC